MNALVQRPAGNDAPPTTDPDVDARRALVRAVLSTLDVVDRVAVLHALAAWWRALVLLTIEGPRGDERAAELAWGTAESIGRVTVVPALVAVWTRSSVTELHRDAVESNGPTDRAWAIECARPAFDDIAAMLEELTPKGRATVEGAR